MKYNYVLTGTFNNPDSTITALFEVALADGTGKHFERATGPDLQSICARLGIEPDSARGVPGELPPKPPQPRWTVENFAASRG